MGKEAKPIQDAAPGAAFPKSQPRPPYAPESFCLAFVAAGFTPAISRFGLVMCAPRPALASRRLFSATISTVSTIRTCARSIFAFALLFSSGCRRVTEPNLVGTYRLETPCVTVSLILNQDHSFVQSARTSSGETKKITGKWSLSNRRNEKDGSNADRLIAPISQPLEFDSFLDLVHDNHGEQLGGGSFLAESVGATIRFGPVIVHCSDSEYKVDYVRK